MHPQPWPFNLQLFLDFRAIVFPEWPLIFVVITIHQVIWPSPGTLHRGYRDIIWIRFAAEALRFSIAKSSPPPFKMGRCERPDRGIYSISRGRRLYCLHFGFSQFMRFETYSWIFVPVLLLSNRNLYEIFSANLFLFVPNRGDAIATTKIFSIWPFNLKGILATVASVPMAWYKRNGFTENICYKLRSLSQPSSTDTNIQEYASGPINWLKLKCKQYKLRPHLTTIDTTIKPL